MIGFINHTFRADPPINISAQCLVFGAVGAGKSTLLAGLAGQQSPSGSPAASSSGAAGAAQAQPTAAGRVEVGGAPYLPPPF